MTNQEALGLKVGDMVAFVGAGQYAIVCPYLTVGQYYTVGGTFHGRPGKRHYSIVVGIEQDDRGVESWCFPDEVALLPSAIVNTCHQCDPNKCDPDSGLHHITCDGDCDGECESEEFCKKLLNPQDDPAKEPPCRCASPSRHDPDCAWKKWKYRK